MPRADVWVKLKDALRTDWVLVATGSTLVAFASGVAHARGYFSSFGFDALVLSLPPEYYVAVGAVTVVALSLLLLFAGLLLAAILSSLPVKWSEEKERPPERPGRRRMAWTLVGCAAAVTFPFIVVWRWLVPLETLAPSAPGWVVSALLVLMAFLFLFGTGIAFRRLRGRALVVFLIAWMSAVAPLLSGAAGEQRATILIEDPHNAPRALVWWNATATPEEYVVVHQEGETLYLVAVFGKDEHDRPRFRSTAIRISDAARVDFLPSGANGGYAFNSPDTPKAAS